MRAIYQGLDLGVLELIDFSVDTIYEENMVDYLYTRGFFHAIVIVNGEVRVVDGQAPGPFMSYNFGEPQAYPIPGLARSVPANVAIPTMVPAVGIDTGPANMVPRSIVRVSNLPPLTHQVIRHRLGTPRGQFYVFSGAGQESGVPLAGTPNPPVGPIVLASPGLDNKCDCKNGPIPHVLSMNAALGDTNTFICEWMCETYFNEASLNNTSPSGPLLSNRFKQIHSVDDESYTTIATQGNAIYRTDRVYADPISPDSERSILFMPIPQGFVRRVDYVEGMPDVTGIMYGYTDTQQKANYVAGPYTHSASISVLHRQAVSTGEDVLSGALSVYDRTVGVLLNNKWLKERGDGPPGKRPIRPGAPGASRLRGGKK